MRCSNRLLTGLSILSLVACGSIGGDYVDGENPLFPDETGGGAAADSGQGGGGPGGSTSPQSGGPVTTGVAGNAAGSTGGSPTAGDSNPGSGMGSGAIGGGANPNPPPPGGGGFGPPGGDGVGGSASGPTAPGGDSSGSDSGANTGSGPGGIPAGTDDPGETDEPSEPGGNDGPGNPPAELYPFSDPNAKYPFPQRVKYPHGVQSNNVDDDFVANWYQTWKSRYLTDCNGMVMPSTESTSVSKVEAQGFAMIAAAYMADKAVVDGLYAYYQSKVQGSSCNLSAWHTTCGGVQDSGAATDGDIDVASGLVVAHWQWPNEGYDDKARGIINNLGQRMLTECSGLTTVYPGCSGGGAWGGCDETDISYYSPGFFRYFAKISGDSRWEKLANDTNTIRDNAAHAQTGLVPDWQSVQGRPGAGSRVGHYGFDAIRTPFKHALDYLWHGTEPVRAWCEKVTNWAYGVGVGTLVDSYQLDGSPAGQYHNMAVVGSLAVCASANTQEVVDAFVAESAKLRDDFWYSGYLGNLYLLAMSGNMWHRDMMPD